MTVAKAQREISSAEFAEWIAYDRIDPFGEERADLRAAIIAATVANAFRGKNGKTFMPVDFMPLVAREGSREQTPTEMKNQLKTAFGVRHGHDRKSIC